MCNGGCTKHEHNHYADCLPSLPRALSDDTGIGLSIDEYKIGLDVQVEVRAERRGAVEGEYIPDLRNTEPEMFHEANLMGETIMVAVTRLHIYLVG